MADGTVINEEFSDDRTVGITGDETSLEISALNEKISDLERENSTIIRENKEYKQRIEELKASIKELSAENVDLKKQVDTAQSENKTLGVVAARAAELETDVSRLQHDLVLAMSDLQESTVELSSLKGDLEGIKSREKEKDVKLEAVEMEKALLVAEVEKLPIVESSLRVEVEGKEKEIQVLKNNVEELEVVAGNSKSLEKLKNELQEKIEKMKEEISRLENILDEKEKVISGFEMKERAILGAIDGGTNGDAVAEGGKKGLIGGLKQRDWLIIRGSTIAAVAIMGVACYIHAARKH